MSPTDQTLAWVEAFVIAHNLCPFAARPFRTGGVVARPVTASSFEDAFRGALTQVQWFVERTPEKVETLLIVFPTALADFGDFLDVVYGLEDGLASSGLDQEVQLAHFHPAYCFEGVAPDDPTNRTNRSPYPIIQLLRVATMARAIAAYPDVGAIPERNMALMRELFRVAD